MDRNQRSISTVKKLAEPARETEGRQWVQERPNRSRSCHESPEGGLGGGEGSAEESWSRPPTPFVQSRPPSIKDNCINLFPIRRRNSRSFGLITLLNEPAPPTSSGLLRLSIKFSSRSAERPSRPSSIPLASFLSSLPQLNYNLYESRPRKCAAEDGAASREFLKKIITIRAAPPPLPETRHSLAIDGGEWQRESSLSSSRANCRSRSQLRRRERIESCPRVDGNRLIPRAWDWSLETAAGSICLAYRAIVPRNRLRQLMPAAQDIAFT